ncbi:glycosyltransferase family 87 protein [Roseomonas sp. CAU 1739]|uniref:glycosyltransferase family 87 protein n=1 Tax=Roseomonas sp. CAU 1739 TaxID=3140364 RepID=UPI00325B492A
MTGPIVLVFGSVVVVLYALVLLSGTVLRSDMPMRADLLAFLAAARLAAAGQAASAYDWETLQLAQAAILGTGPQAIGGALGWLNPPHFFFLVLPLAAFGYGWAWLLWTAVTALLLAAAAWTVLPRGAAVIAVLAAPSVMLTASVGQNGLLIAALFAFTFALMDRRPLLAGLALGLLTVKPQFGLLLPALLLLSGRWRVFGAAAIVALAAMGLAWAAFGTDAWLAFLPSLAGNADRMLGGEVSPRVQSIYAFLARLTGRQDFAMAGHALVAVLAASLTLYLWLRRPEASEEARAASAIAASYLMTPYVWGYDTPALPIAALFLARAALRDGWLPGEKALLLLACLLPAVLIVLQHSLVMPLAWGIILGLAWRRGATTITPDREAGR